MSERKYAVTGNEIVSLFATCAGFLAYAMNHAFGSKKDGAYDE